MRELHKHWKGIIMRGTVAVIFGLVVLFYPGFVLKIFVLSFGVFAFIDGVVAIYLGARVKSGLLALEGIVGIILGLYVFSFTLQAAVIFIMIMGIWAIATGILEIFAAIELRRHIENEVWLLFIGIISILFGVFIFTNPVASTLALTFAVGIYAIIFGLFLIALGIRIKTVKVSPKSPRRIS